MLFVFVYPLSISRKHVCDVYFVSFAFICIVIIIDGKVLDTVESKQVTSFKGLSTPFKLATFITRIIFTTQLPVDFALH